MVIKTETAAIGHVVHITRNNHLLHMTRVLPILAIIFIAQCFLIPSAFPELQLGNLYFIMSVCLCFGVSCLYLYDTQIQIFIKDQSLHWQIPMLKIKKSYSLLELHSIDVYDPEQPFSNLKLSFGTKKKTINLFFIDNPALTIQKLWEFKVKALKDHQNKNDSEQFKDAA